MARFSEVDPATARKWTADGDAVLVDVRLTKINVHSLGLN